MLFFPAFVGPVVALGCPDIDGLVDYNCDGEIRVAITGDSIVRGVGDEKLFGYPGRLERLLPAITVSNIGVPGITCARLRRDFMQNLAKGRITTKKTRDIDYFVIQCGTNDYWNRQPASFTTREIRRLKKYLERELQTLYGVSPIVVSATLPPTKRAFQNPFLSEVNQLLRKRKKAYGLQLFFDRFDESIISDDLLHPNGRGYQQMARYVRSRLMRKISGKLALSNRSDLDEDGLFDELETLLFNTDPLLADSDGDTLLDGDEVFVFKTNPLNPDTDGDGRLDQEEIEAGTNPLVPDRDQSSDH